MGFIIWKQEKKVQDEFSLQRKGRYRASQLLEMCQSGQLLLSNTNSNMLAYSLGMGRKIIRKTTISLSNLYVSLSRDILVSYCKLSRAFCSPAAHCARVIRQRTGVGAKSLRTECLAGIHMACRQQSDNLAPKAQFAQPSSSHPMGV